LKVEIKFVFCPGWRRGTVVITSASRTEDRGFRFRQVVSFRFLYIAML
jgi:hypothetical protein